MKRSLFAFIAMLVMCVAVGASAFASPSPAHPTATAFHQDTQHAVAIAPDCKQANGADCLVTAHNQHQVDLKTADSGYGAASALRAYEAKRAALTLPQMTLNGGGSSCLERGVGSDGVVAWIGAGSGDVMAPLAGKKGGGKKPPKRISA